MTKNCLIKKCQFQSFYYLIVLFISRHQSSKNIHYVPYFIKVLATWCKEMILMKTPNKNNNNLQVSFQQRRVRQIWCGRNWRFMFICCTEKTLIGFWKDWHGLIWKVVRKSKAMKVWWMRIISANFDECGSIGRKCHFQFFMNFEMIHIPIARVWCHIIDCYKMA